MNVCWLSALLTGMFPECDFPQYIEFYSHTDHLQHSSPNVFHVLLQEFAHSVCMCIYTESINTNVCSEDIQLMHLNSINFVYYTYMCVYETVSE